MLKRITVISLLVAMAFAVGCDKKKQVAARVGSAVITVEEVNARIAQYPANLQEQLQKPEFKARILDQMVDELLVLQAAEREGYLNKPEVKTQLEQAKKQILVSMYLRDNVDSKVAVTDDEVNQFYQTNMDRFKETEQRHARHILVQSKEAADQILAELRDGKNFETIAKTKSIDPTKDSGGDLGWFSRGQLVPEFENAVFALKRKGALSDVVKTQFGFHIIKLEDVRVRPKLELERVSETIRQSLTSQKRQATMQEMMDALKKKIKIKKDVKKLS